MVAIAPVQLTTAQHAKVDEKYVKGELKKNTPLTDEKLQASLRRLEEDEKKDSKIKLDPKVQQLVNLFQMMDQLGIDPNKPPKAGSSGPVSSGPAPVAGGQAADGNAEPDAPAASAESGST